MHLKKKTLEKLRVQLLHLITSFLAFSSPVAVHAALWMPYLEWDGEGLVAATHPGQLSVFVYLSTEKLNGTSTVPTVSLGGSIRGHLQRFHRNGAGSLILSQRI